jgi:serine/threonine protein kinase
LKLYRHRLEPKIEILNRITEISRRHSDCFVLFHETGFDEVTGRWYELQEYIPSGSLKDLPGEVLRSEGFAARLVSELAVSIQCLHDNGIIHCDLKPANVLVRSFDPLDLVLTDFGISSLLASDMSQKMTGMKGTPMYWAPEAFSRIIGRSCDWWGLGMILLEILTGEHPFEGLNDSQIIHRLTVGNVDVPESVGPDWNVLLRGLLTKDDAKRWGKGEVDRWMSGERDIPVFYETGAASDVSNVKPFKFDGADFYTKEDLAAAFAAREEPWRAPSNYLRFVRQWLESNLEFDEAVRIGNDIAKGDPGTALFRFIHSNARIPFGVWGRIVNLDNLYIFLWRAARREAGDAEQRITEMLGDGSLSSLYGEYAVWGDPDTVFGELLDILRDMPPSEQFDYISAMREPEAHIWPGDADTSSASGRLECMKHIGSPPLKLETAEDIKNRYALPDELWAAFDARDTYASGMDRLRRWNEKELLIPKGADCAAFGNLSADGYERVAKMRLWGHTTAAVKQLNELEGSIYELNNERQSPVFDDVMKKLESIRDKKISPQDRDFLDTASALFSARRTRYEKRRDNWVEYGFEGTAILAAVRVILGLIMDWSGRQWANASFILLMLFVIGFLWVLGFWDGILDDLDGDWGDAVRRGYGGSGGSFSMPALAAMFFAVLIFSFPFVSLPAGAANILSYGFPLIGAPFGVLVSQTLYNSYMERNMAEIIDACTAYCYNVERTMDR